MYLGFGSNLGNRHENLRHALELVEQRVGHILRVSTIYETSPWGFDSENMFLNCVICCETLLTPREVLTAVKQIEREMGRQQPPVYSLQSTVNSRQPTVNSRQSTVNSHDSAVGSQKSSRQYTDRPIDIDILLYDNMTVDEPDLKIPHPLMHERLFVMLPLEELLKKDDALDASYKKAILNK